MWIDFFDQIYLINLPSREDRFLKSVEQFCNYEIPFKRIEAIHDKEQGARGLRDTMLNIFNDAVSNNYSNILVFEDDAVFVKEKYWVHKTMEDVVKQLPESYHLFYLGGQPTIGYSNFYSPNILPALKYFATHAVAYSKQGIREIMSRDMDYPIDNWIVSEIQSLGRCYAVHPLLCSQRPDVSDIGGNFIDWRPFIEIRHEQKIAELNSRGW